MAHRSTRFRAFRTAIQVFVVGTWLAILGTVVLLFAVRTLSLLSAAADETPGVKSGMGLSVTALLTHTLYALYDGGVVTFGVGGAMMAVGGLFIVSASR